MGPPMSNSALYFVNRIGQQRGIWLANTVAVARNMNDEEAERAQPRPGVRFLNSGFYREHAGVANNH